MRFMLKTGIGSVATFTTCDGKIHVPGDVVDLPPAYKGEAWLQPVDVEPIKPSEPSKPVVLKAVETAEPIIEHIPPKPRSSTPHK